MVAKTLWLPGMDSNHDFNIGFIICKLLIPLYRDCKEFHQFRGIGTHRYTEPIEISKRNTLEVRLKQVGGHDLLRNAAASRSCSWHARPGERAHRGLVSRVTGGNRAVGLFNRSGNATEVTLNWDEATLSGKCHLRLGLTCDRRNGLL